MNAPRLARLLLIASLAPLPAATAATVDASPPRSVSLAVHDTGYALVTESRSATLAKGLNGMRFTGLPDRLDPATAAVAPASASAGLEMVRQRFRYDLADAASLLAGSIGRVAEVESDGARVKGILLATPAAADGKAGELMLKAEDGSVVVYPSLAEVSAVVLPEAGRTVELTPVLLWTGSAAQDGPQGLRLSYAVGGIGWEAAYEAFMPAAGGEAFLTVRAGVANRTSGRFQDARVRLIASEKGQAPPLFGGEEGASPVLRYALGGTEPVFERAAAAAGATDVYDLPQPVTLEPGSTVFVQLAAAPKLPLSRFYVYDGVRFDRYQRNRRTDWNYGTESHRVVETHVEFVNAATAGLGMDLPPGRFRLYRQNADGSIDLAGDAAVGAIPANGSAQVLVGPARGLVGERERTGYAEITPLHEYEESFEIRLENTSADEAEIRVIEHLYRWSQFEIVKADTDYKVTGPQTIEFRPSLKPGTRRAVHYTVRYRW